MLKIRRSRDRLIFNMGIPIPGKDGLYIETGPWFSRNIPVSSPEGLTQDCVISRAIIKEILRNRAPSHGRKTNSSNNR